MADNERLSFADETALTDEHHQRVTTAIRESCPAHQIALVWDLIGAHYHDRLREDTLPMSRFKQLVRDINLVVALKAASAYAKTLN